MSAQALPRPRIPMDVAFQECAAHVRHSLETLGIRWSDQAEQAAVCTMLIQAGRSGWIQPWNPPPQAKETRRIDRQQRGAAQVRVSDPPSDQPQGKAVSPIPAPVRVKSPTPGTSDGARATAAASNPKNFPITVEHFEATEEGWR